MNHEDASRTCVADTLDLGEVCGVGPHFIITPLCHRHALYALVILCWSLLRYSLLVTATLLTAAHYGDVLLLTANHCSLLTATHYSLLLTAPGFVPEPSRGGDSSRSLHEYNEY